MAYVRVNGRYLGELVPMSQSTPATTQAPSPIPTIDPAILAKIAAMGPGPDAKPLGTTGLLFDSKKLELWYNATKIAIIPAVLTAIAVKVIMFGGSKAGAALRRKQ